MATFPMTIRVRCMGEFENFRYVGGITTFVAIFSHKVFDLRYSINYELTADWRSNDYKIWYLSESQNEKHLIESDEDLWQFCVSVGYPVVYVDHGSTMKSSQEEDEGTSASGLESQVYVPSFEYPQSAGIGNDPQAPVLDEAAIVRYASLDPFGASESWGTWQEHGTSPYVQYTQITNEQPRDTTEPETVPNQEDADGESDNDSEDVDYADQTDDDESEDLSEAEKINFSMCEFASWMRREGGMTGLLGALNSREPEYDADVPLPSPDELTNWLVPVIPLDPAASFADAQYDPSTMTELRVGSEFHSKDEFAIIVGLWNLRLGAESYPRRSDRKYVVFDCKHSERCPFTARASSSLNLVWTCYKFIGEHTCSREVGVVLRVKASSEVVAAHVAEKIYDDSDLIRPKTIRLDLQREFGVRISYGVALRARNQAIELIYGGHANSYQLLPSYLYMLRLSNPGSIVDWEIGPDGCFKHCFVALAATRFPFMLSMRPVVVIDGTHLKGKGKGVLFIAATKDGNEQLYPLAYGVGPKENDESWKWFLARFKVAYGDAAPLLVISDAHVSIANAVQSELEHATHGLCYYHLQKKMRLIGNEVWKAFRRAAYTYEQSECDEWMRKIKTASPAAYNRLKSIGEEKWARSKCQVLRYSFMTSNAAESFNSRLVWARRLPICSLLEAIRIVIEQWFGERHAAACASEDLLTQKAHERLAAETSRSSRHTVKKVRAYVYRVKSQQQRYLVDLDERSCECGVFQIDQLPCSHAIAAIREAHRTIGEYVGPYYTRESLVEAYSGSINHLPPRHHWTVPEEVSDIVVHPPIVTRQAGRPRQSRFRGAAESSTRSTRAHQDGASSARRRAKKKCSICGDGSHTRRKCPYRAQE